MGSIGAWLNLQNRRPSGITLRSLIEAQMPQSVEEEVNVLAQAAEERQKQDAAGPSFRPANPMQSILEGEKQGAFNALQNIPFSPLASAVELASPGAYDAMTAPVEGANPEVPNMLAAMDQMSLGGLIDTPVAAGLLRTKTPSLREMAPARLRGRPAGSIGDLATAEPFYSQARTVLEDPKTQGTQTGEAWSKFLTDPKRGVKTEEMEYTGLGSFLKSKGGQRVTKDEIQSHLDANEIEVKEVRKGAGANQEVSWEPDSDFPADVFHGSASGASKPRYVVMKYQKGPKAGKWTMEDSVSPRRFSETYATQEEAQQAAKTALEEERSPTKFSQYTLPGAENYREVLLQLPSKEKKAGALPAFNEWLQEQPWYLSGQRVSETRKRELYDEATQRQNLTTIRNEFRSGHWDEPNVLAHLRLSDRTVNGKRTLLVEEIQSDWAQKGRKEGFALKSEDTAPMDSEYRALVHKNAAAREAGQEPNPADVARAQTLEAALERSDKSKIPTAPFVTDTGKWTALGLKRVLKMAADEGYDSIGIVPGVEQAKRYDLSKQISEVHYSGTNFKAYDHNGNAVIEKTGVQPNELSDLIGKDAAEKLMAQTPKGTLRSISGVDLQVGGEGMKGYYDKIVPDTLNKLAKEFGVKVQIEGGKVLADVQPDYTLQESGNSFIVLRKGKTFKGFSSREAAQEFLDKANQPLGTPVHTLEVPESMKKQIKAKGFPLYSKNSLGGLLGAQNA